MIVGFSGTRKGMSESQRKRVAYTLTELLPTEFHHGDCLGADAEFHEIVVTLFPSLIDNIIKHPSNMPQMRAFCKGGQFLPAKPPLDRNKDIVKASDKMIIAPATDHEVLRSGTWMTYRYAKGMGKEVILVTLSGLVPHYAD